MTLFMRITPGCFPARQLTCEQLRANAYLLPWKRPSEILLPDQDDMQYPFTLLPVTRRKIKQNLRQIS